MCTSTLETVGGDLRELVASDLSCAVGWVTPSVRALVAQYLPQLRLVAPDEVLTQATDTLVAIGGGTLIDRAKVAAKDRSPALRLVAVPSIWGSGAEASPIVVLNGPTGKIIRKASKYLPDRRIVWPELARSIGPEQARHACGDCWAHAVEGFLSPLADAGIRGEFADIIREMLAFHKGNDPAWFELSARACAAQARCSVGLVHGIAHTIECELRRDSPGERWGHARICATLLYPVLHWTRQASDRCDRLFGEFDLDVQQVLARVREFFEPADYQGLLPAMDAAWPRILRDPCTRTNGALARPRDLEFFRAEAFA